MAKTVISGIRKQAERASSAEALLDATAQILSEITTIDVSLSEISRRSGVNSAMIKYHFGNKEGLLLALLERDADHTMDALNALVAMEWSAKRKLTVHIQGIISTYYRSPYLNRLIHYLVESGSSNASGRVTEIFIKPMIEAYSSIIAQGVEEGTIREIHPGLLYYALVGAADHIFHASYSVPAILGVPALNDDIKRQFSDFLVDVFLKGLEPTQ